MNCPSCTSQLEKGFLYVRGIGGSLFWSTSGSTNFISKKDLEQLDLERISTTSTGAQAVLPAFHCTDCGIIVFETK